MALDLSKTLCTRDGRVAVLSTRTDIFNPLKTSKNCITVEIQGSTNPCVTDIYKYDANGIWRYDGQPSRHDLVNEMPWHEWLRHATIPVQAKNDNGTLL